MCGRNDTSDVTSAFLIGFVYDKKGPPAVSKVAEGLGRGPSALCMMSPELGRIDSQWRRYSRMQWLRWASERASTSPVHQNAWVIGALSSVVPDLDVIGFRFGVHYGDFWGHRGFTHSILFAALLASVVVLLAFWQRLPDPGRFALWTYFFLATASHGLLDAMTDGGLGVAFFSPFNNNRYFLPWRPIHVSPIGVSRFFSHRGLAVVQSELLWIWLPATLLVVSAWMLQGRGSPRAS